MAVDHKEIERKKLIVDLKWKFRRTYFPIIITIYGTIGAYLLLMWYLSPSFKPDDAPTFTFNIPIILVFIIDVLLIRFFLRRLDKNYELKINLGRYSWMDFFLLITGIVMFVPCCSYTQAWFFDPSQGLGRLVSVLPYFLLAFPVILWLVVMFSDADPKK